MAIEILKQGQTKFTVTCANCGCEFTYELEDIVGSVVICPCCGNHIVHTKSRVIVNYPYGTIPCLDNINNTQLSSFPKSCEECDFYKKNLAGGKTYIGDSPCEWCPNYPYKISWCSATSAIKTK